MKLDAWRWITASLTFEGQDEQGQTACSNKKRKTRKRLHVQLATWNLDSLFETKCRLRDRLLRKSMIYSFSLHSLIIASSALGAGQTCFNSYNRVGTLAWWLTKGKTKFPTFHGFVSIYNIIDYLINTAKSKIKIISGKYRFSSLKIKRWKSSNPFKGLYICLPSFVSKLNIKFRTSPSNGNLLHSFEIVTEARFSLDGIVLLSTGP